MASKAYRETTEEMRAAGYSDAHIHQIRRAELLEDVQDALPPDALEFGWAELDESIDEVHLHFVNDWYWTFRSVEDAQAPAVHREIAQAVREYYDEEHKDEMQPVKDALKTFGFLSNGDVRWSIDGTEFLITDMGKKPRVWVLRSAMDVQRCAPEIEKVLDRMYAGGIWRTW